MKKNAQKGKIQINIYLQCDQKCYKFELQFQNKTTNGIFIRIINKQLNNKQFASSFGEHNNFIMPKMLIVTMENEYPFSQKSNLPPSSDASVVVRQTVKVINNDRNNLIAKATFIKNLRNRNLVRVESILQQQHSIHILYEYVPSQIDWKNEEVIKNVHSQMKQLTTYLSNIGVKINLIENRIGISETKMIKYFMGLDFQWEDSADENALAEHYQYELKRIFGYNYIEKPFSNQVSQVVPFSDNRVEVSNKQPHDRKVSFATLPSRYNRLIKIDQQLNNIKTSTKDFTQQATHIFNNFVRSQSNEENLPRKAINYSSLNKMGKRNEDRKYSGDAKLAVFSKNKLQTKQSDICSELGRNNRAITYEANRSQIQTNISKTRIEEMKYKEYKQITQSNKNYLKDFISVLQDNDNQPISPPARPINPQYKMGNVQNTMAIWKDTNLLQSKAKQAINNSLKAIKKFKSLGI